MRHDSLVMFDALALIAAERGNPMEPCRRLSLKPAGGVSNPKIRFRWATPLRSHLCRTGSGRTPADGADGADVM